MRLSEHEIRAIGQAAKEVFLPGTSVYLFGSRLDDSARGGDIDLLVEPEYELSPEQIVGQRNSFIARLYGLLGEQRIDVLVIPVGKRDGGAVVEQARRMGRMLAQL